MSVQFSTHSRTRSRGSVHELAHGRTWREIAFSFFTTDRLIRVYANSRADICISRSSCVCLLLSFASPFLLFFPIITLTQFGTLPLEWQSFLFFFQIWKWITLIFLLLILMEHGWGKAPIISWVPHFFFFFAQGHKNCLKRKRIQYVEKHDYTLFKRSVMQGSN